MKDFKLTFSSLGYLVQEITKLLTSNQNKSFRVNIVGWKEKRSLSQNNLYWKWMGELAKQAKPNGKRFDGEVWAELFKSHYCPEKTIDLPFGEQSIFKSTTKLDTGEMHFYLNQIEAWCMQQGYLLTIPDNCEYKELLDRQIN
ncbi:MAG: recombination protein NinB [Colwellia sp.]|nr:recombination protein NinB [Colwellia sp.]